MEIGDVEWSADPVAGVEVNIMEKINSGEVTAAPNTLAGQPMPDVGKMNVRINARIPMEMFDRIEAVNHPDGVSGVVREALTDWLDRHEGREAQAADAWAALEVLQRVLPNLLDAA